MSHLAANENLRRQYRAYPAEVCTAFGLSAEEASQFQEMNGNRREPAGARGDEPRLRRVRQFIPSICALLGDDLLPMFSRYGDCFPADSRTAGRADALQFTHYLTSLSEYPIPGYPYANEVIDCEQTRLELLSILRDDRQSPPNGEFIDALKSEEWKSCIPKLRAHIFVKEYHYPLDIIINHLIQGKPIHPDPGHVWILFAKCRQPGRVIVKRIRKSTQQLISRCDGTASISTILIRLRAALKLKGRDAGNLDRHCHRFLLSLAGEGLLDLLPDDQQVPPSA